MHTLSLIRRMVLLAAFLPQLAMLGLGRSVIVCIDATGQMELEVAASGCCGDLSPLITESAPRLSLPEDESACESCSDFALQLDPRPDRSQGVQALGLAWCVIAAPPLGSGAAATDAKQIFSAPPADEAGVPAQHLVSRPSVQLIC